MTIRIAAIAVALSLAAVATFSAVGCVASHHAVTASKLGTPRTNADLLAVLDQPGALEVETLNSADWQVDRSGLINLEHPHAREAGLEDGPEPISVFFHVIRHPTHGTFIIDTGIERALRDAPEQAALRGMVADVMKTTTMKVHLPLGDWLDQQREPLRGVLMTHLHLDHVSGMPDVPRATPVYAGPGETTVRSTMNVFTQGTLDRALDGMAPINEWTYVRDEAGPFEAVVDVFGDGSLWALSVPGHTPGTTAYLARTPKGPVLFVGDASHTAWGWTHDVEPGTFTADAPRGADSFQRLRRFVAEHPSIDVRLGHQRLAEHGAAHALRR